MTKVLIVDDHAVNLYVLRALLEGYGYEVEEARHGAEGLAKARKNPPALAISDLLMPVLDGFSFLRQWRADAQLKHIPFVVYTATYVDPGDERLAMSFGADAFIVKPAEPEPFIERIREVLANPARHKAPDALLLQPEEHVMLRGYNEVLVRKLEQKALEAEETNRELRAEIADRMRTEEVLRLRDRAIQEVSQGILITDARQPDHPIIYASAGFERMTGYRLDEAIGRNCRFLQGKDTNRATVQKLREAVAAGRACAVEILNYRKDGTPFWNALSMNPVHDETGVLAHFVGVQSDVTGRKQLEEQLRQAQKMEAVGRLAGGVAHDFNNLLTIIGGCSDLLLDVPGGSDSDREVVKAIRNAGQRAAELTRQLLSFSRRTILQPEVLDVNAVVAETGKMLQRLLGEDILLTTVLDPHLNRVRVDPGQLNQVLMNLAVNARDAMPEGGTLTIETSNIVLSSDYAASHLDSLAGPHVMLAITDSGCGMTPEVMARIFEPFFTTKAVDKGTGLGLPMVFGIVRQSDGSIHVYSEPGHGTTFKIYFPVVAEQLPAPSKPLPDDALRVSETVLLVEDEAGVRALAARSLQKYGYDVLAARDGQDALMMVQGRRGPIDLVLTDVVMPKVSGPEMVERLRGLFPAIKVLFMSGYTDDAVVRHGLLDAEVSFIQKPYTSVVLARKVRQVLDQRAAGGT